MLKGFTSLAGIWDLALAPPSLEQWSGLFSCATLLACEEFMRWCWFDQLEKEKKADVILKWHVWQAGGKFTVRSQVMSWLKFSTPPRRVAVTPPSLCYRQHSSVLHAVLELRMLLDSSAAALQHIVGRVTSRAMCTVPFWILMCSTALVPCGTCGPQMPVRAKFLVLQNSFCTEWPLQGWQGTPMFVTMLLQWCLIPGSQRAIR